MKSFLFLSLILGSIPFASTGSASEAEIEACRCGDAEEAAICIGKVLLRAIKQSGPSYDVVIGQLGFTFGSGQFTQDSHQRFCASEGMRVPSVAQIRSLFGQFSSASELRLKASNNVQNGQCIYASTGEYVCYPDFVGSANRFSDFSAVCVTNL
jgi:hypothetical protein